ncbi:unnamed protein product [Zymoseptoria tritici ST99CH_1A5]|uniref:Uncharacterized protein n=1 Tax=Zymoseptoria tritici ST99CH_1A5 TaxID=1276529 RepID=A0A1Y6LWU0_ZYMTR|nr:unnamed protein product [Zymoseptoria tritici ST99CH_1A5]
MDLNEDAASTEDAHADTPANGTSTESQPNAATPSSTTQPDSTESNHDLPVDPLPLPDDPQPGTVGNDKIPLTGATQSGTAQTGDTPAQSDNTSSTAIEVSDSETPTPEAEIVPIEPIAALTSVYDVIEEHKAAKAYKGLDVRDDIYIDDINMIFGRTVEGVRQMINQATIAAKGQFDMKKGVEIGGGPWSEGEVDTMLRTKTHNVEYNQQEFDQEVSRVAVRCCAERFDGEEVSGAVML